MKFIFQKKILIFSIIFFIVSFLIFLFLYKNINDNKEISQLTQKKWQIETAKVKNTKLLINSIKSIEPEKALLETHFVQNTDIVPFLDTIEKLAKEVGVNAEITSVNLANDNSSLILRMKASGSFGIIYKLIMLLENSPYDLNFILVDLQASGTSIKKVPQWTVNFQMKLLSFVNK